jgi:hypothetical protein
LLHERGLLIADRGDGSWLIKCPRDGFHSVGRAGDGSTLLFLPPGSGKGRIKCMHSCADLETDDWLDELGAAGVKPPKDLDDGPEGDLSAAADELEGRLLAVELAGDRITRIESPRKGDEVED